jgi:plastocyanin
MNTSRLRTPLPLLLVLALGLALTLAGCGGSSSSSSASSASGASGNGTPIAVTLKDFSISMDKQPTAAGAYTFTVTNAGPSSHNLTVSGPGVTNQATPTFASGTQTLTVTLQSGTYDFFCSVPGHKAAGMNMQVTVS